MKTIVRLMMGLTLAAAGLFSISSVASAASDENCGGGSTWQQAEVKCTYTHDTLTQTVDLDVEVSYTVFQACTSGTSGEPEPCWSPQACQRGDATGTMYGVRRDGVFVGTVCLVAGEEDDFERDVADYVVGQFRRLDWPSSGVEVQPGGRTLVNLDTIFYTANDRASSRTVTLVGQRVRIEAVPVEYAWSFGDGSSVSTESAGFPYAEGQEVLAEGRVTHRYEQVGEGFEASVDTTYRGRYQVGDGPWVPIESTLTVEGDPVSLAVVEARPQLVR